ncbi:MAG: energy transducer TonB [Pseudolabrys sp.]|nr:energy transducer TonB [Pseudolabrys sp.]
MIPTRQRLADGGRWVLCFAIILTAHIAAGAVALLARTHDDGLAANPPVITLELAPVAAAPETPQDVAIGPQQVETPEVEKPPPPPDAIAIEPPKPREKPPEKKKAAKLTTVPAPAEKRAAVAATPMSGAAGSNALPSWKSSLVAALERSKRYPSDARGDQGVAQLAFSVDRSGGVHNARIMLSSGSSALDKETLALARRVSPLPAPPTEIAGSMIPIVVPIRYHLH